MERSAVPDPIHLVVIDVSFISLTKVLPAVTQFLRPQGLVVALIKPQFEVGKGQVGRGGIVRDEGQRAEVVQRVVRFAGELGLLTLKTILSAVKGKKGNQEIFAIFEYNAPIHDM
jgi:23S rRNA (cytidine1920-2'-O)/16S rRNA (cytidine1409-2'-O)-methyltransferase